MKRFRLFLLSVSLTGLLMALMIPIKAQADSLPFSVSPILSKAQRNRSVNYFDVLVENGKSAKLQVQLMNQTDHTVKVQAQVHAAQTNDAGKVDYSLKRSRDPNLKPNLADLLKGPTTITIPAKQNVTYTAVLTMPTVPLDGLVAGALMFSPAKAASTSKKSNFSINNQYQYVIAVVARTQNQTWSPQLKVSKAQIRQDAYQNTIAVPYHNLSGTFLNQMRVRATATNVKTGKVIKRTADEMQMAPHSHFYYRLPLPDNAQAGKYRVMTSSYFVEDAKGRYQATNGKRYRYHQVQTSMVRLSVADAKALNNQIHQAKGGIPWFIYAIVIGFAVMLAIILGLLCLLIRRHRHQQ